MHRRLGNSAVPGNLLGLARLYERIINDEPPLAIQGARIGSHSVFHFFHRQMCCCTRDSCHTFPLLFSVITSFILSQYADWYEMSSQDLFELSTISNGCTSISHSVHSFKESEV